MIGRGVVRVLALKTLRMFWEKHADAEQPLRAWYKVTQKARWKSFHDLKSTYRSASQYRECYVFNVHGNHYRLIAKISPDWKYLFVCLVLTHPEYDRDAWKETCQCSP
jgi:mRNA interferase HigB